MSQLQKLFNPITINSEDEYDQPTKKEAEEEKIQKNSQQQSTKLLLNTPIEKIVKLEEEQPNKTMEENQIDEQQYAKIDNLQKLFELKTTNVKLKEEEQQRATYWLITAFFDFVHEDTDADGYMFQQEFANKVIDVLIAKFQDKIGIKYICTEQCKKIPFLVLGYIQFAQLYQTYFPIIQQSIPFTLDDETYHIKTTITLEKWKKYTTETQYKEFVITTKKPLEQHYYVKGAEKWLWEQFEHNPTFCYELSNEQVEFYNKYMKPKQLSDYQRYVSYMDNLEISNGPLLLYLSEKFKKECVTNGNIQGVLEKWLSTQQTVRENIGFNPLAKDKKVLYKLPDYIRNSQLHEHVQITEWFNKYCKYPQVKSKCLVLYSTERNMGKTVFAKSLVSDINSDGSAQDSHLFTIVINALSKGQFQNMQTSRLLIFDDLQSFDDINKNQEQWKSVLTSQISQLRGLYLNQQWKGLCPVIVTTNNLAFVSYLAHSPMFTNMCYRVKITKYLGPPGTEPIQLNQDDPNQTNGAFEYELDQNQQEWKKKKEQKKQEKQSFK